jgi:hypothetical protein
MYATIKHGQLPVIGKRKLDQIVRVVNHLAFDLSLALLISC